MEADSEGEINMNMEQEVSKRPKRQMKTPFQLEVLEETYATDTYPSEATRAELSEKLNLTDRQLQMWFCHRRLKDKKEASGSATKPRAVASTGKRDLAKSSKEEIMVAEPVTGHESGSSSASGSSEYDNGDDIPMMPMRYHESPGMIMAHKVVARIELQLGESLRNDGPILGVEFDEVPPGAFGAPIVPAAQKERYRHSYDNKLYGEYEGKHIKVTSSVPSESAEAKFRHDTYGHSAPPYTYDSSADVSAAKSMRIIHGNGHMLREYDVQGQFSSSDMLAQSDQPVQYSSSPRNMTNDEDTLYLERKRKIDEVRNGKEVQAYEKKMKKELEKQELLRRKMEEQMRKEMERQDRERRKEEQRMIREQQKLEEKYQREERREMERREKFMQKERLRLERNKQKEERRKEKEAMRQKAAMERAAARRIAKESLELIEDERLELMELAASSKGLSSIVSLDYVTMQNLELFREALCEFPPKSVELRKPFLVQPWADSEENVGDLLMVWKFCVTFADVLGLLPFTLDDFMQSLHDYDSRLLGEIHIALLKLIVKDIEDVVRTPSGGPGTNQYSAVNPEGGHPHIIEGAYFWGFDIRNWQKHLNPLTWPEILRQFALSAGFGPHLKKKGNDRVSADDEIKGCEDIVSTLRNGSAAENAVAIMQEKGFNLQRKSRHRLTPGTVKFAAYHVLALEGSKGLNVIDLAEKIQKSGLRDLTTSKTPEASISVALSRDPILFERIAPSTYCVRPAYRKDPADAESVIAVAKEKIQRFTNGFLTGQNADEEERDDESDGDIAEGTEIDAVATPAEASKNIDCDEIGSLSRDVKDKILGKAEEENGVKSVGGDGNVDVDQGFEVDGDKSGEPWIEGLAEGEYSDLCVEERLKALVALVGIANEGNSIRVILEERQDAASTLKKQMWAEAQLDKRRIREEIFTKLYDSSFNAVTAEGGVSPMVVTENKTDPSVEKHESSLVVADVRTSIDNPALDASLGQQNGCATERSRLQLKSYIGHKAEEMYVYRSLPLGQDRRRNRYWHFVALASPLDSGCGRIFVESPNGCWRLIDSEEAFDALMTSLDTRGTRESHLHIMLQKIEVCFKAGVQRNRLSRDVNNQNNRNKGIEVSDAHAPLDCASGSCPSPNSDALESSPAIKIDIGSNDRERWNRLKRYEDLQIWAWKECCNPPVLCGLTHGKKRCLPLLGICDLCLDTYDAKEQICPSCGEAGNERNFSQQFNHVNSIINGANMTVRPPVTVRLIKALLNSLEVYVPSDALDSSWSEEFRRTWAIKLQNSSSSEELVEMLTLFENAIRRDHLSASFETTKELLCHYDSSSKHHTAEINQWGSVRPLPWIPQTSAAVALRLLELNGSITYSPSMMPGYIDEKKVEALPKVTLRYGHTKNTQKNDTLEFDRYGSIKAEKWSTPASSGSKQAVRGRGGARPRSAKSQKGASVSAPSISAKRSNSTSMKQGGDILTEILNQQKPIAQGGQKHVRGPRTVRKRRIETVGTTNTLQDYLDSKSASKKVHENLRTKQEDQYFDDYSTRDKSNVVENDDDSSQSMEADEDDSDGHRNENTYGFEKWGPSDYADVLDTCNNNEAREMSEEDLDEIEEEIGYDGFQTLRDGMQSDDDMETDGDNAAEESSDSMASGDDSD